MSDATALIAHFSMTLETFVQVDGVRAGADDYSTYVINTAVSGRKNAGRQVAVAAVTDDGHDHRVVQFPRQSQRGGNRTAR